jgi:prepilin-type N-terminal cleavage/methylation domain-containing protein
LAHCSWFRFRNQSHGGSLTAATKRRAGFTLVEVLISVVILSTGIVVVLQGLHASLSALDGAVEKTRSAMLLRTKIIEAQAAALDGNDPSSLTSSGLFSEPYDAYRWRLSVNKAPAASEVSTGSHVGDLYEVGVAVWRDESPRRYTAATLVYVPAAEAEDSPPRGGS